MATEVSVSELPTAEEEWEAWNVFWVAGLPMPGQCIEVDGERRRDVEHKKSKGSSRDILIDQGLEPTQCTVKIRTTDGQTFRALYDFYVKYLSPDRPLTRLNVVPVSHPQCYARGIKMGYFFGAPVPKPTSASGIRPYIHEFKFKIVGPKTQISGASGSSKPKQQAKISNPFSGLAQYLVPGLTQVAAVGFFSPAPQLLPGVSAVVGTGGLDVAPPPPPNQIPFGPPTPAQVEKAAAAGDVTARFVSDLLKSRAP